MPSRAEPLTTDELAGRFDVTPKAIAGWVRAGCPVLSPGGRGRGKSAIFDIEAVALWVAMRPPPMSSDWALIVHEELADRAEEILADLARAASVTSTAPLVRKSNC